MAIYEKINFTTGQVLKANQLDHMEEGILSLSELSEETQEKINILEQKEENHQIEIDSLKQINTEEENQLQENFYALNKNKGSAISKEAVGDFLVLTDTISNYVNELKIYGKTTQKTTTGKNLLNSINAFSKTSGGITFTVNEDQSISITGTSTEDRVTYTLNSDLQLPVGTYRLIQPYSPVTFIIAKTNRETNEYVESIASTNQVFDATQFDYTTYRYSALLQIATSNTTVNGIAYPMICLSSVLDTTYEPYTGGISSPNPEYAQNLVNVGTDVTELTVCGKNLFMSDWEQGDINIAGIPENNGSVIRTKDYIPVSPGCTYSIKRTIGGSFVKVRGYDVNKTFVGSGETIITLIEGQEGSSSNNPMNGDGLYCIIKVAESVAYLKFCDLTNDLASKYMMVLGNEIPTEYESYLNPQSLILSTPNGLPGIPVSSNGNYTDENGQQWLSNEIDLTKGVLIQKVISKQLTSDLPWNYSELTQRFYTKIDNVAKNHADISFEGYCSHYPAGTSSIDKSISYINEDSNGIAIKDIEKFNGNLETFKTWLNENEVWVMARAEKSVEIPLNEEELSARRKLQTYDSYTTIFNSANTYMSVKYLQDTKEYIDNLVPSYGLTGKVLTKTETGTAWQEQIDSRARADLNLAFNEIDRKAPAIEGETFGKIITMTNASNNSLLGLNIYGKTIQDGEPTPENPVDMVNVGNGGSIGVNVCGKNLLANTAATQEKNGVAYTVNPDGTVTANGTASAVIFLTVGSFLAKSGVSYRMSGCPSDGSKDTYQVSARATAGGASPVYGDDNGSGSTIRVDSDTTVYIIIRIASGYTADNIVFKPMVSVASFVETGYEPYAAQSLSLSTPSDLPGIPVSSGGNYTDADGQQWVCDEIDLERGVYVQRVIVEHPTTFSSASTTSAPYRMAWYTKHKYLGIGVLSNVGIYTGDVWGLKKGIVATTMSTGSGAIYINMPDYFTTVDELNTYAAQNPIYVMCALANPIETPLSAEELAVFVALHTNKPNTTIFNDANADMTVKYIVDTKNYIDTQIPNDGQTGTVLTKTEQGYAWQEATDKLAQKEIIELKKIDNILEETAVIKCEDLGEIISITNSSNMPFYNLKVFGKTKQTKTTGKNLLQSRFLSETKNGLTYTTNTDGSITINGTATANTEIFAFTGTLPAGTYILTGCPAKGGDTTYDLRLGAGGKYHDYGTGGITCEITEETSLLDYAVIMIRKNYVANNLTFYPMLRLSSISDATYEPYTGGIPSPNPEFPQELVNAGAEGSIGVTVAGKNLIPYPYTTKSFTTGGLSYTMMDDGAIKVSGTKNGTSYFNLLGNLTNNFKTEKIRFFNTIHCMIDDMFQISAKLTDSTYLNDINGDVAINQPIGALYLECRAANNTVIDTVIYPMISYSDSDAYEPYISPQTLALPVPGGLPGIPVSSGGNYTDESGQMWICDEVDFEKGVYIKRVGAKRGAELTWSINTIWSDTNGSGIFGFAKIADMKNGVLLSNTFKQRVFTTSAARWSVGEASIERDTVLYALISNAVEATPAAFAAYMSEIDAVFMYQLITPVENPLPAEAIAAYRALRTHKPNTTVFSDSNVGLYLNYAADTKLYIDNKFTELKTALLSMGGNI